MVVCTALIAVTDTKKDDPSSAAIGVNFPGGKQVKDASTCTDQDDKQRRKRRLQYLWVGWMRVEQDKPSLLFLIFRCYSGVTACTGVFCVDIKLDTSEGKVLNSKNVILKMCCFSARAVHS